MKLSSLVTLVGLLNYAFASNARPPKVGQPPISIAEELKQKGVGTLKKTDSKFLPNEEQRQKALKEEELRSDKSELHKSSLNPQGLKVTRKHLKEAKVGDTLHKLPDADLAMIRGAPNAEKEPTKPVIYDKRKTLPSIQAPSKEEKARIAAELEASIGGKPRTSGGTGRPKSSVGDTGYQEGTERPSGTKKLTHAQKSRVSKGPPHRPPTIGRKDKLGTKGGTQRPALPVFTIPESNDNRVLPIEDTGSLNIARCSP